MSNAAPVGRSAELAVAEEFLAALARAPATLVYEGEPGIGKTTLWQAAVRMATDRGIRVLRCRPVVAEARLTHVALGDLLGPVEPAVFAALPDPQRRALEVSLLRADPGTGPGAGPRVVATAFLGVLRALAARSPVLVAVDDFQWIDPATRGVLEFALRRLADEPVGLLAAVRTGVAAMPSPLVRAGPVRIGGLDPDALERIVAGPVRIGGLHPDDLERIVADRLGADLPRPAIVRIVRAAGGNPMFAIEIGRAVLEQRAAGEFGPPAVPDDLGGVLVRRLRRLPPRCRHALLAAAAQSDRRLSDAECADLRPAEQAGVIAFEAGRARFTHPLLAAAIYRSVSAAERQRVHRELAAVTTDQESRARHLALGAAGPDEDIAAALAAAAGQIRSRGAPDAAAELLELAVSMTPDANRDARGERAMAAAENLFHAGDRIRAGEIAAGIVAGDPPAERHGRALRLLGMISYHDAGYADAIRLFTAAVERIGDRPLVVDLHVNLSHIHSSLGDMPASAAAADAGLAAARRFGDRAHEAVALGASAMAELLDSRPPDWDRVDAAVRLEDPDQEIAVQLRPSWMAGAMRLYCDEVDAARPHLTALRQRMIDRGEESDLPFLSFHLAMLERLAGQPAAAIRYADEGYRLARQLRSPNLRLLCVGERSLARATGGDIAGAGADAAEAVALATRLAYPAGRSLAAGAAGFHALAVDDAEAAAVAFEPVAGAVEHAGACHAVLAFQLPDAIEAFARTGRVDRAAALAEHLRRTGDALRRPNVVAVAGRCDAYILAARGDLTAAVLAAEASAAGATLPLDRARALLLTGQLRRRLRQKRLARTALAASLALFDRVGAASWSGRVAAELARVGQRTWPATLTVTEEQVARLAATGLTNREIAARSFISPKTVESNLARAYRKLGIHTRAELGAVMRDRERDADA